MNKIVSSVIGGLALLAISFGANAAALPFITGTVQFEGRVTLKTVPGSNPVEINGVDFTRGTVNADPDDEGLFSAAGDLVVMLGASTGNGKLVLNDFLFTSENKVIWAFDDGSSDFKFTADSITHEITDAGFIGVYARGKLSSSGFQDTDAEFSFTTQLVGDGFKTYKGSFSTETTVVPLPSAVWLFGSALLGLVGVARHRQSSPA